jgi:hypothetical protein
MWQLWKYEVWSTGLRYCHLSLRYCHLSLIFKDVSEISRSQAISKHHSTVGSRFATVRFTTTHFYDPCRVGPSNPDLRCNTFATQASFLYLSALLSLFRCACVSSFFYFSAVLLSWLWFFHPWRPSKRQKRRKNQNSWLYVLYLMSSEPRPGPSSTK